MRTHYTPKVCQELGVKVHIQNGVGNTFFDLSSFYSRDWIQGVSIRQSIDAAVADCEVRLSREQYELSLSPLDGNSAVNSVSVLLRLGALLVVRINESGVENEIFRGKIDEVDFSSSPVIVRARDLAGTLQDTWSETPRGYAIGRTPYGVRMFEPGATVAAGEILCPSRLADSGATGTYSVTSITTGILGTEEPAWTADGDGSYFASGGATLHRNAVGSNEWAADTEYFWGNVVAALDHSTKRAICIQAGISDGSYEPEWPAVGAQVDDGTVRWAMLPAASDGGLSLEAVMGAIILDNGGTDSPEMYTPVATGYWRNPFLMQESSVLDTLRNLALEIGWDLRLRYCPETYDNEAWGYWRLYLYEPARSNTTADFTLTADDYYSASKCAVSTASIRNVIEVHYDDRADLQADGVSAKRKYIKVTDSPSIVKYGRRFMAICEGSANGVNTTTEATALANAVLSDLKEPGVDLTVVCPLHWWVELNDLVSFSANGVHFNAAQKLAVVGIQHEISASGSSYSAKTTLACRGAPTAGIKFWHERAAGPGKGEPGHKFRPEPAGTVAVVAGVKGGSISFTKPKVKLPKKGYGGHGNGGEFGSAELHMSGTDNFTPTTSTLKAVTSGTRFDVTGLVTGTPQYGRIIIKDAKGVDSVPSEQFTLTPTQAALGDLDDSLKIACAAKVSGSGTVDYSGGAQAQVPLDSEVFDDGGGMDIGNNEFIAPTAGAYRVYARAYIKNTTFSDCNFYFVLKSGGSNVDAGFPVSIGAGILCGISVHTIVAMDASDDLELWIYYGAAGTVQVTKSSVLFTVDRVWSR